MINNRKTVLVAVDVSDLHMALILGRVFSKNGVNFEIFFVQSGLKSSKTGEGLYRKYGNLVTFVDSCDYSIVHGWHFSNNFKRRGILVKVFNFFKILNSLLSRDVRQCVLFHQDVASFPFYVSYLFGVLNKRVVLVPAHMPVRENQVKAGHLVSGGFRCFWHRLTGRIFPKWYEKSEGQVFARLNPLRIWIHQVLGMVPRDPWFGFSYRCDAILVDNFADSEQWARHIWNKKVLKAVGRPSDLIWARVLERPLLKDKYKNTIYRKFSEDYYPCHEVSKGVLVLMVAPDQQNKYRLLDDRSTLESYMFSTYGSYIDRMKNLYQGFKEDGWSVVLSLHPRNASELRDGLEREGYWVCGVEGRKLNLIADVVVSYIGSTLVWEFERFGLSQVAVDLFSQKDIVEDIVDDFRIVEDVDDLVFSALDKKISQALEQRKLIESNFNLIKSNAALIKKELLGCVVG